MSTLSDAHQRQIPDPVECGSYRTSSGQIFQESAILDDGRTLLLCKFATASQSAVGEISLEKWALNTSSSPRLIQRTTYQVDVPKALWRDVDGRKSVRLLPSPGLTLAPPSVYDFAHMVLLGAGVVVSSEQQQLADQQDLSFFLSDYWGGACRRGDFLVVARRKRPFGLPSEHDQNVDSVVNKRHQRHVRRKRRARKERASEAYDGEMDFDDLPDEQQAFSDNEEFDITAVTETEVSEDDEAGSEALSFASPPPSLQDEEDEFPSLSDLESDEAASESSDDDLSLSDSSSLSVLSTNSVQRLRTAQFLTSSDNPLYHRGVEMLQQYPYRTRICDICRGGIYHWFYCFVCSDADWDGCFSCISKGLWCEDEAHQLLEADADGPILMHSKPGWRIESEIRCFRVSDKKCVFDLSTTDDEDELLHESRPALHPTLSILAWPLSSTKILICSFEGGKGRAVQRVKPFVKGGHKIAIDVRFSSCGSYLFVASIEAVRHKKSEAGDLYSLHMQVAIIQLHHEGEAVVDTEAIGERHLDLNTTLPLNLEALPFHWTWTDSDVYLTLVTDCVTLYHVNIRTPYQASPELSIIEKTAASIPHHLKGHVLRPHMLPVDETGMPTVLFVHTPSENASEYPSIEFLKCDSNWGQCGDEPFAPPISSTDTSKGLPKGVDLPVSSPLAEASTGGANTLSGHNYIGLNKMRSEIRLLYLLPGSGDDRIRCRISNVSLDDLESAKSKLVEHGKELEQRGNEKQDGRRPPHDLEAPDPAFPDFVPRVLARVDYSDASNRDEHMFDLQLKSMLEVGKNLKEIRYLNVDRRTAATIHQVMGWRNGDTRKKNLHHPKYNYEALSYVWGESKGHRTIIIDGNDTPVTDNLYAALRRLRRPGRERVLWIDALCINQRDMEERSSQVLIMNRIYSCAASVVVWLGDADDLPRPAMPDDSTALTARPSSKDASEKKVNKDEQEWQSNILTQALNNTSTPWWTRCWVVQELILADDATVAFGQVEVKWSYFQYELRRSWQAYGDLDTLIALRENRRSWRYKGCIGETALLSRQTNATNPRDKVYGLLGLVKPSQAALIKPNYSLSVADVYIQATFAEIWDQIQNEETLWESPATYSRKSYESDTPRYPVGSYGTTVDTGLRPDRFRILNWAKPNSLRRLSNMPSWAVDFSDSTCFSGDTEFRLGGERWTFDGNNDLVKQAEVHLSTDRMELVVRGVIFDSIEEVIDETPVREYRSGKSTATRVSSLIANMPTQSPYQAVTGSPTQLRADDRRTVSMPNWVITETRPGVVVVKHEEHVTAVLEHWNPDGRPHVDWTKLGEVDLGVCKLPGCRCGPSRFFRAWDECVGVPSHARNFFNGMMEKPKTSPWEDYCRDFGGKGDESGRKTKDPLANEDTQFLFATSCGFLGLGPDAIRKGDVIALFYGSDVPVVLRPEGDDRYRYCGRAWINGIMLGELWNIYEDPKLQERDFVLC